MLKMLQKFFRKKSNGTQSIVSGQVLPDVAYEEWKRLEIAQANLVWMKTFNCWCYRYAYKNGGLFEEERLYKTWKEGKTFR